MAIGHSLAKPREDVPVRRSEYEDGTVTYDWMHEGHKVFIQFLANGGMKFGVQGRILKVSAPPRTMSGVNRGVKFTNVGLEPVE